MSSLIALLALLAATQARDFELDEESELLEFYYSWPAQAQAVPGLRALLRRDMEEARGRAAQWARDDRSAPRPGSWEFNPHSYEKEWEYQGGSARLISLSASESSYTGGAHPNHGFTAILWDRVANRAVEARAVLGRGLLRRLRERFCTALDTERADRREGAPAIEGAGDPFAACPPLADQVVVPVDEDENGRFEIVRVLIPPYVAGPYAEGSYELELDLTPRDIRAIPGRFRPGFEAGESEPAEDADVP